MTLPSIMATIGAIRLRFHHNAPPVIDANTDLADSCACAYRLEPIARTQFESKMAADIARPAAGIGDHH
jgi:hypothetical protein